MPQNITLRDAYRFPGCIPAQRVRKESQAFVVTLVRGRKKVTVVVAASPFDVSMTRVCVKFVIWIVATAKCSWSFLTAACSAHGVA